MKIAILFKECLFFILMLTTFQIIPLVNSSRLLNKNTQLPSNCFQSIKDYKFYEIKCTQPNGDLAFGLIDLNKCIGNSSGNLVSGENYTGSCSGCTIPVVNGPNPSASINCRCNYETQATVGSGSKSFSNFKNSSIDLKNILSVDSNSAQIKCKNNAMGSVAMIQASNPDTSVLMRKICYIWLTYRAPKGSLFHFSCPDNNKGWVASFIDLNKCMGLNGTSLTRGKNYSSNCHNCELYIEENQLFRCTCNGTKTLFAMDYFVQRDKTTNMMNCYTGAHSQLIEDKNKYAGKIDNIHYFLPTPIVTDCNSSISDTTLTSKCNINGMSFSTSLDLNKCIRVIAQNNPSAYYSQWDELKGSPNGNFSQYPCKDCRINSSLLLTCGCSENPLWPASIMPFKDISVYLSDIVYINTDNKLTCFEEQGSTQTINVDEVGPNNIITKKLVPLQSTVNWNGDYITDPASICNPDQCTCNTGITNFTVDGSKLIMKGSSKWGNSEFAFTGDWSSDNVNATIQWYETTLKYKFKLTDKQIIMENIATPMCSASWNKNI